VSHLKERTEKTCLNCQTSPLYGRYCHVCGQENLVPKETVWHLVQHFFEDITHFDGKFFATVKYLLKRPGFLSTEYMIGRRASYLNPIRMYVFTSAIFFLILFSLKSQHIVNVKVLPADSVPELKSNFPGLHQGEFKTVRAYDSVQSRLPDSLKDGWMRRFATRRFITIDQEYQRDSRGYSEHLLENFLHSFPKILFFSLPFFALILRLLYARRKQYLYVDHGIFTIHLYCATFILMLANILLGELSNRVSWEWFQTVCNLLIFAIVLYMFVYLFMAMRSFYRQGWWKTLFKYVLLGSLALVLNGLLLLLFLLISAISI
jgi:hypothetical protein